MSAAALTWAQANDDSRWLAPLLAQTFPLPGVLVAWDAIFTREARQRDSSPRLEFLVDICAAMLLRLRVPIMRYEFLCLI